MSGALHASKRAIQAAMEDVFGVPMSLGAVPACEEQVSQALAEPVAEADRYVQSQVTAHADETGFPLGNRLKGWLWVLATTTAVAFKLQARRSSQAFGVLLGSFAGILHTDRWSAYNVFDGLRQLCWAHLKRDFTAISEFGGVTGKLGVELLRSTRRMFHWWHRVRDGTMTREEFKAKMRPLSRNVETCLERVAQRGCRKAAGMCAKILKQRAWLWTFVEHEGVEPTNNAAERAIRPAVLWRKGCFGVQSERGRVFVERILTAQASCRLQKRKLLPFLHQACLAKLQGTPAPSLLPIG